MCDDKPYSDELVAYGSKYADDVYDHNKDLTPEQVKDITAVLQKAMIYKVAKIDLSLCSGCCESKFSSHGLTSGSSAAKKIQIFAILVMLCQLSLSLFTSIIEGSFYDELKPGSDRDDVILHCRTLSLPLSGAQAVIGCVLIYLVLLNYQIYQKITQKDDPFNSSHLLSMLILFVIL